MSRLPTLLIALALTAPAFPQAHSPRPATAHSPSSDPVEKILAPLRSAQQQALSTGNPTDIAASTRPLIAAALHQLSGLERASGQTTEAQTHEQQALRLDPAQTTAPSGNSPQTLQKAELTRLHSTLAAAFTDLGTAEALQQQFPAALADFQQAEHWASPPSPALLRNLGTAAFRVGDYAEAGRALSAFLTSTPPSASSDAPTTLMLAMSLFSEGDFPAAATRFASIPDLSMRDPRTAYAWAFSLVRTGEQKHAISIALELEDAPISPDALSLVCHVFMDAESYEQSIPCYRKAYAEDPQLKLAHYQVGDSLLRLDRPAEAVPELRSELTLSPDNSNVQYSLAFALLQTSQKDEARRLLTHVVEVAPANAQAQYQLGKLLLEENDLPGAITHLEQAASNDARSDYIHYQLQLAYRKAGRTADAARELAVYRELKNKARAASPAATATPEGHP